MCLACGAFDVVSSQVEPSAFLVELRNFIEGHDVAARIEGFEVLFELDGFPLRVSTYEQARSALGY